MGRLDGKVCIITGSNSGVGAAAAELFAKERDLLKGQGCSCCVGKTVVNGINDIATIYPHLVKYFVNIEDAYVHTFGSGDKILMKCPNCGSKKYMTINDLKTNGFSFCKRLLVAIFFWQKKSTT